MTMPTPRRRDNFLDWFPVVSQYLGVLGLIFCAIVWLLTDRLEPTLLGAFGTLLGLSQGTGSAAVPEGAAAGGLGTPPGPPAEDGGTA